MNQGGDETGGGKDTGVRWTLWKVAAAWMFLLAMLIGKGILLGYGATAIAEGMAIGLAALAVIMLVIKYLESSE